MSRKLKGQQPLQISEVNLIMPVNIAVLVKQIPDPTLQGQLDSQFRYVRDGKIVLDEADLYGVEVALMIRDAAGGGEVTAISMVPGGESTGMRTALAMGVDKGIVVSDEALANSHSLATAKVINSAIEKIGNVDLVLAGTESSDGYAGTLPAQIAALRNNSCLTFATSVEYKDGSIEIKRQSNVGIDVVQAELPCVVSVTAGVVEPRYPNFKGIMAAKSKPLDVLSLSDLGISVDDLKIDTQKVVSLEDAPGRDSGQIISDEDEAVEKIVEYLSNAGAL